MSRYPSVRDVTSPTLNALAIGVVAVATMMVALAITTAAAYGASSRAEYVAQVDQTCSVSGPQFKRASKKLVKIAASIPGLVPAPTESDKEFLRKLNRWSRRVTRAVRQIDTIFGAMVERIAVIPPAPGDEAAVAQWVNGMREYLDLNARSRRATKHGKFGKGLALLDRSLTALDTGGAAVQGFGISVCPTSSESSLF